MERFLTFVFLTFPIFLSAQTLKTNQHMLQRMLKSRPDLFDSVLNHSDRKEVQILYTQITRDKNNVPHFKSYSYRLNANSYFYPASTVKLPTAVFALEKINALHIAGFTKESAMITDSAFGKQTRVFKDSTSANGLPSIANYIKKVLLVSDNDAFNRLFEFVGRAGVNEKLNKNGLMNSRILNRLSIGDGGGNARNTNPIRFYNNNELVYSQPPQYDSKSYPLPLTNLLRGKGYIDANDKLVEQPFDFSDKNTFSIADQQQVMIKLIFPESFAKQDRFDLKPDDYQFLYKYLSMYPTESRKPTYNSKEFYPTYCKFLFYGSEKDAILNPDIRIFNKIGDSYGYTIDNSYFVDFKNKVEFLLTAVIQSNNDEIYNDDKYEYETICYPFLKNLGQEIYKKELKRKKKYLPDLSKFLFNY